MADQENIKQKHAPSSVNRASGQIEEGDFDASDKEYLYILGDAFLQCGHFKKAETIFSFIEDVFQNDLHALKCKAYSYLMQERYQESLELITKLKQNKMDEMAYATLSLIAARTYHKLGMNEEAVASMQDFIALRRVHADELSVNNKE